MTEMQDQTIRKQDIELEIYRQKYEVFRHFDNLRWHIPTLTLTAGSLLIALSAPKDQPPAWWSFVIFGLLSLFASFAVFRVRKGIINNHVALDAVARAIGDTTIPPPKMRFGATWLLSVLLIMFGIAAVVVGIARWP